MEHLRFLQKRDRPVIQEIAEELGIDVPSKTIERLAEYVHLVAQWHQKMNLVSAGNKDALVEILLADALILSNLEFIPPNARIIDIGSGAGAPSIPLFLIRDDLQMQLIEARQKRVAFLNTAIGLLGLYPSVSVRHERIDPTAPKTAGIPFDVSISRATFAPELWINVGSQLSHRTLLFTSKSRLPSPPSGVVQCTSHEYRLPKSRAQRNIALYISDSTPSFHDR